MDAHHLAGYLGNIVEVTGFRPCVPLGVGNTYSATQTGSGEIGFALSLLLCEC